MAENGANGNISKAIAGAATIISIILGFIAYNAPLYREQEVLRSIQDEQQKVLRSLLGHLNEEEVKIAYHAGKIDQQLGDVRKFAEKIDVDLQREFRDINNSTETKLVLMDQRLQAEISNTTMLLKALVENTRVELQKNNEFILTNRENVSKLQEQVRLIFKEKK